MRRRERREDKGIQHYSSPFFVLFLFQFLFSFSIPFSPSSVFTINAQRRYIFLSSIPEFLFISLLLWFSHSPPLPLPLTTTPNTTLPLSCISPYLSPPPARFPSLPPSHLFNSASSLLPLPQEHKIEHIHITSILPPLLNKPLRL